MDYSILEVYQKLSLKEVELAITQTQEQYNKISVTLNTLKVIKMKKEVGIDFITIRESQREYQRKYYLKKKYGKKDKIYGIKKPYRFKSVIDDNKVVLEI